jgi:hypothetical protein
LNIKYNNSNIHPIIKFQFDQYLIFLDVLCLFKVESTLDFLKKRHKDLAELVKFFGLQCVFPVGRAFNECSILDEELERFHQLRIDPDVLTVTEFIDRVSIVVLGILG